MEASFQEKFREKFFLRFHMSFILAGVCAAGLITSRTLFACGVKSMLLRYPLVLIATN
jgi:hypothetical protein